jgi:hypothetical protein
MGRLVALGSLLLAFCLTSVVAKEWKGEFFPGVTDVKYEVGIDCIVMESHSVYRSLPLLEKPCIFLVAVG